MIFVTSATYGSDLGGLNGADRKCQALANQAGLAGVFKALLSTVTVSAASRLTHATVPYVLLDGTVVATDWNAMTSLSGLSHAINMDDMGASYVALTPVWTNTLHDGSVGSADDCGGWTGAGTMTRVGLAHTAALQWSGYTDGSCSSSDWRLYCVQQ